MYMYAKDFARSVLDMYWNDQLPVNPVSIAKKLGINIVMRDEQEVDSFFDKDNNKISIKSGFDIPTQRVLIAHEIAHAVLGHGSSPQVHAGKYSIPNYMIKEFQANEFVRYLLIPTEALNFVLYKTDTDYRTMLDVFDVPDSLMTIRLKSLGIF